MSQNKPKGWKNEPGRHALSSYGIKTSKGKKLESIIGKQGEYGEVEHAEVEKFIGSDGDRYDLRQIVYIDDGKIFVRTELWNVSKEKRIDDRLERTTSDGLKSSLKSGYEYIKNNYPQELSRRVDG